MPIRPENKSRYPKNWQAIRKAILKRAKNACERCGAKNGKPHPMTGSATQIQIMHLNHIIEDCDPSNLMAGCQRCHLKHDEKFHRANRRKYEKADIKSRFQKFKGIDISV